MAAQRNTSYTRAFSSSTDLWETVDNIMVDLVAQPGSAKSNEIDGDVDHEQNARTQKKNEELEKMMGNLDTILDDLQDISEIDTNNNNNNTYNEDAEEKMRRKSREEFLEKENPFDSITQSLLNQAGDVPLWSSSADSEEATEAEAESNAIPLEAFVEQENGWESEDDNSSQKDAEIKENLVAAPPPVALDPKEAKRLEDAKEKQRVKDRIAKYSQLDAAAKVTKSSHPLLRSTSAVDRVQRLSISPTVSKDTYRSRPLSTRGSVSTSPFHPVYISHYTSSSPRGRNTPPASPPPQSPTDSPASSPLDNQPSVSRPSYPNYYSRSTSLGPGNRVTAQMRKPPSVQHFVPLASIPVKVKKDEPPTLTLDANGNPSRRDRMPSKLNSIFFDGKPPFASDETTETEAPKPTPPPESTFVPATGPKFVSHRSQPGIGQRSAFIGASRARAPSPSIDNQASVSTSTPIPIPANLPPEKNPPSESSSPADKTPPSSLPPKTAAAVNATPRTTSQNSIIPTKTRSKDVSRLSGIAGAVAGATAGIGFIAPLNVVSTSPTSSPNSSPLLSSQSPAAKAKPRFTPVGQHRTAAAPPSSRLIFGGSGVSVQVPQANSKSAAPATSNSRNKHEDSEIKIPASIDSSNSDGNSKRQLSDVKERHAKIKQLRSLVRRYHAKLTHVEGKQTRELTDLQNKINNVTREAAIHIRTTTTWGQHVLTRGCRHSWQTKIFMLHLRHDILSMQIHLLQNKITTVEQLMTLVELEYSSSSKPQTSSSPPKNDFVIYSSFFKDPQEVMTNPEVERNIKIKRMYAKVKRKAKNELNRLKLTYQPEPIDRRIRRLKDILARLHISPVNSFYVVDDILQADFDSIVVDQRLLEGRHILHLKTSLIDDFNGEHAITPNEVVDFIQQFSNKMSDTFGVTTSADITKLLLLCKRAIYPTIYEFLTMMVPLEIEEQDVQLAQQMAWLSRLDPVVLREGLKLDKRLFQFSGNQPNPYEPAIEALNEIAYMCIPTDMILAVHKAFKLTYDITISQAKAVPGMGAEMGMDDVFPVFLWVVTQCSVARLCRCVYFMDYFSDGDEKISVLGYAATSLAAAVAHLTEIEREPFLNPSVVH